MSGIIASKVTTELQSDQVEISILIDHIIVIIVVVW